jgi:hypothetical protein
MSMQAIRAHFDGLVIIPDEPVTFPPNSKLVILLDSDSNAGMDELNRAAKEYYQNQSAEEKAEDEAWGRAVARDSHLAWDEE